jgi:hypothetical protein
MTPEALFSLVNLIALASWILLAAFPRRAAIADRLAARIVPATLAVVYTAIVAVQWTRSSGGFSSLADVSALFDNPWLLLAGWIHYLAFDLYVGSWEVRDARERGLPHLAVLPCLVVTFLFGPAGFLLYLAVRAGAGRPSSAAAPAR